jgi:tetratricopeptide (TPR) repeat protein
MNKFEKYGTMLVALVGAVTGGWSVYTDYDKSEFLKPIHLREATVKSFQSQIKSANQRKDDPEVLRVSLEYEKYEELWRNSQQLAALTAAISNLVSFEVTPEQSNRLDAILDSSDSYLAAGLTEPEAIASAYLVTGDFSNATKYFEVAALNPSSNPNLLALRSIAWAGKAELTTDPKEQDILLEKSFDLATEAVEKGIDSSKLELLSNQLKANKSLKQDK